MKYISILFGSLSCASINMLEVHAQKDVCLASCVKDTRTCVTANFECREPKGLFERRCGSDTLCEPAQPDICRYATCINRTKDSKTCVTAELTCRAPEGPLKLHCRENHTLCRTYAGSTANPLTTAPVTASAPVNETATDTVDLVKSSDGTSVVDLNLTSDENEDSNLTKLTTLESNSQEKNDDDEANKGNDNVAELSGDKASSNTPIGPIKSHSLRCRYT